MVRRIASRALTLGGLLAGVGFEALAQDPPQLAQGAPTAASGIIAYPISFFIEYRPTTASDVVGRIPGFTYKAGDDVRGFGGAAGNVLIDGERPSSKAVTLDEALKRIPVAQIERVELIRGGAPGIDMQGQAVLANVIRRRGVDYSLAYEHMAKFYSDHAMGNAPRLEGSRQIGGLTTAPVHSLRRPPSTTRVAGRGCLLRSFAILIPFAQCEWSGRKLAQAPTPVSFGVAGSAPHSLQLPS